MRLPGIAVRSLTLVDIFQRHNIFLLTYKISLMLLLIYFSSEQALNFSPLPLNWSIAPLIRTIGEVLVRQTSCNMVMPTIAGEGRSSPSLPGVTAFHEVTRCEDFPYTLLYIIPPDASCSRRKQELTLRSPFGRTSHLQYTSKQVPSILGKVIPNAVIRWNVSESRKSNSWSGNRLISRLCGNWLRQKADTQLLRGTQRQTSPIKK
jgi:hypothetical protein